MAFSPLGVLGDLSPSLTIFLCKAEEFGGARRRDGEGGARRERAALCRGQPLWVTASQFSQKNFLLNTFYIKFYIGSKIVITSVYFSFGDSLAEQSQPCCLSPVDTGLVAP